MISLAYTANGKMNSVLQCVVDMNLLTSLSFMIHQAIATTTLPTRDYTPVSFGKQLQHIEQIIQNGLLDDVYQYK